MTVLLKAFGTLTATMEVSDLREKIYLIHREPTTFDFLDEIPMPISRPTSLKAVFEHRGRVKDGKPVYEFIALE